MTDNDDPSIPIDRRDVLKFTGAGTVGTATGFTALTTAQSGLDVTIRQVVRPEFPQIRVFATVRDSNGDPLTNLGKSNFTISEDGTTQSIESITSPDATGEGDVSTALVIDRSGSMDEGKLANAKDAAKQFVSNLKSEDEGAIIDFGSSIDIQHRWTRSTTELKNAIENITRDGSTALYDAIITGIDEAAPRVGRSSVIALTDGQENASSASLSDVINRAQEAGISVYTIGLGSNINESALKQIANDTGGDYYQAPTSSELTTIYNQISQSIKGEYELTYDTTNTSTNGTIRTVTLTANYSGNSGSDSDTYEAPCAPLPDALFSMSPSSPTVGQQVSFDGSASKANGGQLVSYEWDFNNDGLVDASGPTATHTYSDAGTYEARLTVKKGCGARDVAVKQFQVAKSDFAISILSVNDPIDAGDTLKVDVQAENLTNQDQTVSLYLDDMDGVTVDSVVTSVGAGNTITRTLTWDTDVDDAGTGKITVRTLQTSVTEQVTIKGGVKLSDARLVQQVENTRLDNTATDVGDDSEIGDAPLQDGTSDPPLVADKQTTALFDIEVAPNLSLSEPTEVTVTREFSSGTTKTDSFRLPSQTVTDSDALVEQIATAFDIGNVITEQPDQYPVFKSSDDLEAVSIELTPQDQGISGSSTRLTKGTGTTDDFECRDTPALNIGFIPVDNFQGINRPYGEIGDDFPGVYGGFALPQRNRTQAYRELIRASIEYLAKVVPTDRVNVYRQDIDSGVQARARDPDNVGWLNNVLDVVLDFVVAEVSGDMESAHNQLELEIDDGNVSTSGGGPPNGTLFSVDERGNQFQPNNLTIDEFDITMGIVPFRYLNVVRGAAWPPQDGISVGLHMGDGGDLDPVQPEQSAFTIAGAAAIGSEDTVVHEAGHHFIGDPFTGALAQDDVGDFDNDGQNEVRNDSAHANSGDYRLQNRQLVQTEPREELVSTKVDISDGVLDTNSLELEVPSYMSYAPVEVWTDSLTTQRLIESNGSFAPTPVEPQTPPGNITGTFYVSGVITNDGIKFSTLQERNMTYPTPDPDGGAEITVKDKDGNTIHTQTLPTNIKATPAQQNDESRIHSSITANNVIVGHAAYPDETAEVEVTAEAPDGSGKVTTKIDDKDIKNPSDPSSPDTGLPSNVAQFDANNNGAIEFDEVLNAIDAYNSDTTNVDFSTVLDVIAAYNKES